jgi:hypothetical protein
MRARNIKPSFFKNDLLAECHPLARILFVGLWCLADREGKLEDRPRRIKVEILPYDDCTILAPDRHRASTVQEPEKHNESTGLAFLLDQLENKGFILRYSVNGAKYIKVINFLKHQHPHCKETKSVIPEPLKNTQQDEVQEKHGADTVQEPEKHNESPADSGYLIPDSPSLIPDKKLFVATSEEVRLGKLLFSLIFGRDETHKKPNLQMWAEDVDLMIRVDKRDVKEIEQVIYWCQGDSFWQNNVLSPRKLRKQYDQLKLKMQAEKPQKIDYSRY